MPEARASRKQMFSCERLPSRRRGRGA
jgi:hypothetical protein